jgi:hypothetical protein
MNQVQEKYYFTFIQINFLNKKVICFLSYPFSIHIIQLIGYLMLEVSCGRNV